MQGLFSLQGEQGKFLSIKVSKEGYYEYKPEGEGFFYAGRNENFVPDENNPVVFRLHKKRQAEPLIAREFPGFAQIEQLRRDGTPVEIDLLQAKKVASGGNLKMELWGDPIERTTNKYKWKLRISVAGGGIIVNSEEFNFKAPESGYAPQILIDMPTTSEHWTSNMKQKYFVKYADGNYGRIDFDFLARNGVYRILSFINTSGSRNLEYDEAVQPKPSVQE